MADALEDGRFVIVEANQHTGYGVNQCVDDIVEDYLVEPRRPGRRDDLSVDRPVGGAESVVDGFGERR